MNNLMYQKFIIGNFVVNKDYCPLNNCDNCIIKR